VNVLFLSPGYPAEMPFFVRGLAEHGARVVGLGDGPVEGLPAMTREHLTAHIRVPDLWNEAAVVDAVRRWPHVGRIERVECLWEPGMLLAARLREALGLPGMDVAHTIPFRDKEAMKRVLDRAGIRTPRHRRCTTAGEVRVAAEAVGYPLIVKPIAGAGSADTHRVDDPASLEQALRATRHVAEMSVEEFITGEEHTFDTICANGRILYFNVSWYRPPPLIARSLEWVSSQTIALRDVDVPALAPGVQMGRAVLEALEFRDGFTHMEWFRTPSGEAVFGEIGGRPPGARSTEIMNYACDFDVWRAWAEATLHGRIGQPIVRRYNAGVIFKRAQGQGRIARIEGLERILAELGEHVVSVDLLPVGTPRRNWKQTLLSDGWLIVRHPHLGATVAMLDRIGTDLRIHAA
jgi:hypothetical protein